MAQVVYPSSFGCGAKEKLMNSENVRNDVLSLWACKIVFTVFSFVYLYFYQADLLTVMQHIFSKGQTHYNHLVGAFIITLLLLLLQIGTNNVCKRLQLVEALTFVPSSLCLAALTSARLISSGDMSFGNWVIGLPLGLIGFALIVWLMHTSELLKVITQMMRNRCHSLWVNLLVMVGLMLFVCGISNNDKVFHARVHAEQCLVDGDWDGAVNTLKPYVAHDENVDMLIAYALSQSGELANRLFEFRPKGGAETLMPDGKERRFLLYPEKKFYIYLNGLYNQRMQTKKYLDYQRRHHLLSDKSADYLLCAYLLDRDIDSFAENVERYYNIGDSLPKHYKEALVLYQHKRSNPKTIYNDNVFNADFQDYQKLEEQYGDKRERQAKLCDTYGNTYWYYYQYK